MYTWKEFALLRMATFLDIMTPAQIKKYMRGTFGKRAILGQLN